MCISLTVQSLHMSECMDLIGWLVSHEQIGYAQWVSDGCSTFTVIAGEAQNTQPRCNNPISDLCCSCITVCSLLQINWSFTNWIHSPVHCLVLAWDEKPKCWNNIVIFLWWTSRGRCRTIIFMSVPFYRRAACMFFLSEQHFVWLLLVLRRNKSTNIS